MEVTELIELSKARSKVYIDTEFAFVLYKGELRRYGMEEGSFVEEEDYREILTQILPKRAKLRALNLLKSREYTEKQLRDKLKAGFYPAECIDQALDYVKSYRYIDDDHYARQYITNRLEQNSRRQIEQDLRKKGITKEIICRTFQELQAEGLEQQEGAMIKKWMEKRHFQPESATKQEYAKLYGFLYRKGFSSEGIRRAVNRKDEEIGEDFF